MSRQNGLLRCALVGVIAAGAFSASAPAATVADRLDQFGAAARERLRPFFSHAALPAPDRRPPATARR